MYSNTLLSSDNRFGTLHNNFFLASHFPKNFEENLVNLFKSSRIMRVGCCNFYPFHLHMGDNMGHKVIFP